MKSALDIEHKTPTAPCVNTVITIANSETWRSTRGQGAGNIAKHLYVFDFQTIDLTPTFIASLAGIVVSVEQGTESAGGVPMKAFTLTDQRGRQVACLAFGRHADNPQLVNGHEIAIFLGQRKLLGTEDAEPYGCTTTATL